MVLKKSLLAGIPLLGVAVTHLHPGAGRSPGIVDLPVMRDSLGYPMVPASSVKGALKTRCGRLTGAISGGKIDCKGNGRLCCCLFGGEVGAGPEGAGAISVLDLVPLAFPVPSIDRGYLYVAPKSLAARAAALMEAVGARDYAQLFKSLAEAPGVVAHVSYEGEVYLFTSPVKASKLDLGSHCNSLKTLASKLGEIHPLAGSISERLLVLDDELAGHIVDRALLRVTRVRLNRERKTVETGGLWTEEYIPQGTVFMAAVIATGYTNSYCNGNCGTPESCIEEARRELKLDEGLPVFVGGKETVGKGLLVLKAL